MMESVLIAVGIITVTRGIFCLLDIIEQPAPYGDDCVAENRNSLNSPHRAESER